MTDEIVIRIDADRLIGATRRVREVLERNVDRATGLAAFEISREARRRAPQALSTLTNAIAPRRTSDPMAKEVVAGVNYARLVEEGTGPGGKPPARSLLDWIKVRNIQPDDPTMSQEDLAFVMARSIARHGTPPQPYLKPALEFKRARAEQLINQAIDRSLREVGG